MLSGLTQTPYNAKAIIIFFVHFLCFVIELLTT